MSAPPIRADEADVSADAAHEAGGRTPRRRTSRSAVQRRTRWWALVFLLPSAIPLVAFVLAPMAGAAWISLHRWNLIGDMQWVGLSNYTHLLADPATRAAFGHTLYYLAGYLPLVYVGGLALALALNTALRGRAILLGGLVFGARARTPALPRRFAWLAVGLALTAAASPVATTPLGTVALGGAALVYGTTIAPVGTVLFGRLSQVAGASRATEAFGWMGAAMGVGGVLGDASGGWLVTVSPVLALGFAAVLALVMAILLRTPGATTG